MDTCANSQFQGDKQRDEFRDEFILVIAIKHCIIYFICAHFCTFKICLLYSVSR